MSTGGSFIERETPLVNCAGYCPLQMYHRKFLGFGLQYCSQCLLEDDEPYFRRRWRVAYCTFCPEHNALLRDRCWQCGACVAFHRRELGRPTLLLVGPMSICHSCGHDLRAASPPPIPLYNQESHLETIELLKSLESNHRADPRFGLSFHAILHQQCRLIVSERTAPRFRGITFAKAHDPWFRTAVLLAMALTRQQEATGWLLDLIANEQRHAADAHEALCRSPISRHARPPQATRQGPASRAKPNIDVAEIGIRRVIAYPTRPVSKA